MAYNLNTGDADGRLTVIVESRQAMQALSDIEAKILRLANTANSSLSRTTSTFDRFTGVVKKAAAAFAAFVTVRSAIDMFSSLAGKIIEVDRAFRGFIASMSIIRGSTQAAVKEYEFLYAISNKLGIQIETAISQYHRLAASLKNVDQSGELARHIFSAISQAAVVLHAKGRDVTLIFEAIQQMASKGKLSLEELQRQLGNTLPGAVSMAARAMLQSTGYMEQGITTAVEAERKLREQIEKGTINVYEFLALIAQQLKTEYGQGVEYASQQFTANLNRMRTTAYEFFRVVGDSGAIQGLTKIVQEITKLFEDTGNGAREFGRVLGDIFTNVADWISTLDATDVQDFFDAVTTATMAAWVVLEEFLGIFARFSGPEVNSPLLGFAEFVAKTMAAVVDVFKVAVDGIEAAVRSIMAIFLELRSTFGWVMDDITTGLNAVTQALPFSNKTKSEGNDIQNRWRGRRERWNASAEANAVAAGRAWKGFIVGDENNAYNRVSAQFDEMRQGYRARAMSNMPGYQPKGNGSMDITDYTNPLSPDKLKELIDRIRANSGAPNAESEKRQRAVSDRDSGASLLAQLRQRAAAMELELQTGERLSASQRARIQLEALEAQSKGKLTAENKTLIEAEIERMEELEELMDLEEDYQLIVDEAAKSRKEYEDTLRRYHETAQRAIDDLQFEIDLIGKSAIEQQKMIALRQAGVTATSEYGQQIEMLIEQQAKLAEQQALLDDVKLATEDMFASFIDGSKSASEALEDFAKDLQRIATRLLAQKTVEWLFSGDGGVGIAKKTVKWLFGGGWSNGGYTGPGDKYEPAGIVHKGEVIWSQDDVRRAGGVAVVEAMRRGLRGYAEGGVAAVPYVPIQPVRAATDAPKVTVEVNNYTGGQVRTREERTRGPDGTELHRLIVDVLADDVVSGGKTAAAIKGRFGLREVS